MSEEAASAQRNSGELSIKIILKYLQGSLAIGRNMLRKSLNPLHSTVICVYCNVMWFDSL